MAKYTALTDVEHVLKRPGMYIRSVKRTTEHGWIFENDEFTYREITYVPGLVHIFSEILENAQDNFQRSKNNRVKMSFIHIKVENGVVTVKNDGVPIPITKDKKSGLYIPELIFGQLRSGSNFDDETRDLGGMNGIGAKGTNIFSSRFSVTVQSGGKKYKQEWTKNMGEKTTPKITKGGVSNFVEIQYEPDWSRFDDKKFTEDTLGLMYKRVYEAALVTGIPITLDGEKVHIKNLEQYAKMYPVEEVYSFQSSDSKVVLGVQPQGSAFYSASFVNGINTRNGGVHVELWKNEILKPVVVAVSNKFKYKFSIGDIRDNFCIFVVCNLVAPEFEGQQKHVLSSPKPATIVPQTKIAQIARGEWTSRLQEKLDAKTLRELSKTDGKKTQRLKLDPKIDDANFAGGPKSSKCTLILTEGLSAKAFAVSGILEWEGGRDLHGIFPLKGKLLNVAKATVAASTKNEEITNLKKILGLQHGKDYSDAAARKGLRYGRVLILTDADVDGTHIQGLILLFFNHYFPGLLQSGFVATMRTPIIKVIRGKKVMSFYDQRSFDEWKARNPNSRGQVKYYKGLGTSSAAEARDAFKESSIIGYNLDKKGKGAMDLAFGKTQADSRKEWLARHTLVEPERPFEENVKLSDFIEHDLVRFSLSDTDRSIPEIFDGQKTSLRKILYGCILRNLTSEIKVAQLAGYIAEKTCYHHGEVSLAGGIVGLAQDYVGSNNLNLLEPRGQFGTRIKGGADSAATRYIFTQMSKWTRKIFRSEDDPLLNYLEDDGTKVEPKWFIPVIPVVLVNGSVGIGTGYSTLIPSHNPKDLIEWIREWMKNNKYNGVLKPWFRGFTGEVKKSANGWTTHGVVTRDGRNYKVSELPVGLWTETFKGHLGTLIESGKIRDFDDHTSDTVIDFTIYPKDFKVEDLKLVTKFSTNNMHLFVDGRITKFKTVQEIMQVFCKKRLAYYGKRKKYQLKHLRHDLMMSRNKNRFLKAVMDKTLEIFQVPEEQVIESLEKGKYDKVDEKYEYLLSMNIRSFTKAKIDELKKKISNLKDQITTLESQTPKDLWEIDLQELENII